MGPDGAWGSRPGQLFALDRLTRGTGAGCRRLRFGRRCGGDRLTHAPLHRFSLAGTPRRTPVAGAFLQSRASAHARSFPERPGARPAAVGRGLRLLSRLLEEPGARRDALAAAPA